MEAVSEVRLMVMANPLGAASRRRGEPHTAGVMLDAGVGTGAGAGPAAPRAGSGGVERISVHASGMAEQDAACTWGAGRRGEPAGAVPMTGMRVSGAVRAGCPGAVVSPSGGVERPVPSGRPAAVIAGTAASVVTPSHDVGRIVSGGRPATIRAWAATPVITPSGGVERPVSSRRPVTAVPRVASVTGGAATVSPRGERIVATGLTTGRARVGGDGGPSDA